MLMSLVGDLVKVSINLEYLDVPEALSLSFINIFIENHFKASPHTEVSTCPSKNILVLVQNYYSYHLTS